MPSSTLVLIAAHIPSIVFIFSQTPLAFIYLSRRGPFHVAVWLFYCCMIHTDTGNSIIKTWALSSRAKQLMQQFVIGDAELSPHEKIKFQEHT